MDSKENHMNTGEWEKVLEQASKDMCESLAKFGPTEVLDLLVIHSHRDPIVNDLLTWFPRVVSIAGFLKTLPIVKVNKRTLNRLKKRGCIVS
jgi:hypothetical protein